MTLVLVALIVIGSLTYFYLKCSLMQSMMMLWSAVLATIIAFSFYETLANQFLSRGYMVDWALFSCFIIIYVVSFGALRVGLDFLIPSAVDLGQPVKISAAVIFGLLTGIIISGNLLVGLGLLPKQGKFFYSRFDPDRVPSLRSSKTSPLNVDGFVSGLYGWVSSGSMRSDKSFTVLHADYLSQVHLNKLKVPDIPSVAPSKALEIPSEKNKKPVRFVEDRDGNKYTIVRMELKKRDGGSAQLQFYPAQIRLIGKKSPFDKSNPFSGSGEVFYAAGFWKDGALVKTELDELIPTDVAPSKGPLLLLDAAFDLPEDVQPVLLQFKQNLIVDLSSFEVVESTPEVEQLLNDEGSDQAE